MALFRVPRSARTMWKIKCRDCGRVSRVSEATLNRRNHPPRCPNDGGMYDVVERCQSRPTHRHFRGKPKKSKSRMGKKFIRPGGKV